jgi:hypothetical protein
MTEYKEQVITKLEQVPVKVICDRCKREIKHQDFVEIRHEFGYGTEYDGDYIEADICEDCILYALKDAGIKYRHFKGQQ